MVNKLRVCWVPQVPMNAFYVDVVSVEEAAKIMDILARYDLFQFENKVKPDYCNFGGLEMFEDGEWIGWEDEETGISDPIQYIEYMQGANHA